VRILGLLLLLCLAAACGGKSSSTLGSVAKNDLAVMVLPATEFGEVADGGRVDPDSGFQDYAASAEDTLDPDDTAADVEAAGMEAAYELAYTTETGQVSSEVALFGSAEEAQPFVEDKIGDATVRGHRNRQWRHRDGDRG
jgi:hypothetical protein